MRFATLADWLAWQENLHPKSIDLGLGRVARVLRELNLPQASPLTISVGGTNGKGSCVAMLDSIMREAGYRVGTYTSPHILRYNERISIDGKPVDDASIVRAFERIEQVRNHTSLSFFEFGTLAALDIFSREALDARILEVGLGGRLDAVNIIDADIALIASIDIDHREWLGETREAIGREKAGIFRSGRPAVVADPFVPASVLGVAGELGVPLYRLNHEFGYQSSGETWEWRGLGRELADLPRPAIPGLHQLMNASAVLASLELAADRCPVSEEAIRGGLRNVVLPGRSQFFPGKTPVLLDVAHNPQAARILADHLASHYPGKPVRAVFSVMRDKDIHGILEPLRHRIAKWYLAPLRMARAAEPEALAEILHNAGIETVDWNFATVSDACRAAMDEAEPDDLLLVFGSFFLVSEFLANRVDRGVLNG